MTTGERAPDAIDVLHVDDDPDFAELAAAFVERADDGIAVETVNGAEEALLRLSESEFDCVVSDYDMPETDGIELLQTVRDRFGDLPFVLFTGQGSESVASDAIAAGATDYLQKRGGGEQYELLANRVRNAVERTRSRGRAAELDRVRSLSREVTHELLRATSRVEAERRVCETISAAEPYRFVWLGAVREDGRVECRASADEGADYPDVVTMTVDETETGRGPAGTAIREGRVVVSQDVLEDPAFEPWREAAAERGYRAVAAVPLKHDDTRYGVLCVYAAHPGAFDETERDLLSEIGTDVAHALHSLDVQARLRDERDRREALFENAPGPVCECRYDADADAHVIADANDAFEDAFGYDAASAVGRNVADLIVPSDRVAEYDSFRERVLAGERVTAEVERETAAGRREFVLCTIPYGETGNCYAWYVDVTERRRRERAVAALHETVDRLVGADARDRVADIAVEAVRDVLDIPVCGVFLVDDAGERLRPAAWTAASETLVGEQPTFERGDALAWAVYETGEVRRYDDVSTVEGRHAADTAVRSEMLVPLGEHGVLVAGSEAVGAFDGADESLVRTLGTHAATVLDRIERERDLVDRTASARAVADVASADLRDALDRAGSRLERAGERDGDEHLPAAERELVRCHRLLDDLLDAASDGRE